MIHDLENQSLLVRFDHLVRTVSSDRFLAMEGIGNEVPFFICPFRPEETLQMNKAIDNLHVQVQVKRRNINVKRINLYDLCLSMLKEEGVWELIIERESEHSKDEWLEQFQMLFDAESHLAPAIYECVKDKNYDVLFLEGVGEVYPYVRTHVLLENLAKYLNKKPMIMFFPGKYEQTMHAGASLKLFDLLPPDNYYRALNIYRYEP